MATREQIQRIYNIRMEAIYKKRAKGQKAQDELDLAAWQKTEKDTANVNQALAGLNMYKDLYEGRQMKLLGMTYEGDITPAGLPKKYQYKE